MSFVNSIVKLGRLATPSKIEKGIKRLGKAFDVLAHPAHENKSLTDMFRSAERKSKDVQG